VETAPLAKGFFYGFATDNTIDLTRKGDLNLFPNPGIYGEIITIII
jgi:hypothetical protein